MEIIDSIILGDCFEYMPTIPDASVDLLIADPPYGVTRNGWDVGIPLDLMWSEFHRIVKPNGAMLVFGQDRFTARVTISNEANHRYNLVWEKDRPGGFLNAKRMPLRYHEDLMVFYRKMPTYNPQMWQGEPTHSRGLGFAQKEITTNYGSHSQQDNTTGETLKYPRSILPFPRPHPPKHPTEKPVELLEYLIRTYSDGGQVVFDPFAGAGSTAIAAIRTRRRFVAVERDPRYYGIAKDRIDDAVARRNVFANVFIFPDEGRQGDS